MCFNQHILVIIYEKQNAEMKMGLIWMWKGRLYWAF